MTRPLAVLRPEPGNAATTARIAALGLTAIPLPLFAVTPLPWVAPDPAGYDALLITSANALRHGGAALARYRHLPVYAVGEATAATARAAGFAIAAVGRGGAEAIVARAGRRRLLHLAGRDRHASGVDAVAVYSSDALPVDAAPLAGSVALVHSARAAGRLAEVAHDRTSIALAAISLSAARAAGDGWAALALAAEPTDAALIAAARSLAD